MNRIIGIDMGSSALKAVLYENGSFTDRFQTSAMTDEKAVEETVGRRFEPQKGDKIALTGMGASFIENGLFGLETSKDTEFNAVGEGASYLTGYKTALIVSMGTGTAYIRAENGMYRHIGGSGVGGGTLLGLAKLLVGETDPHKLSEMCMKGDRSKVDLQMRDISKDKVPTLPPHFTASNFAKVSPDAAKEDICAALYNMLYEVAAMLAVFSAREFGEKNIIFTGNLAVLPAANLVFSELGKMFGMNFSIPENGEFAGAMGAVLRNLR